MNDMVSILKGNYTGEVGLFVCYTKAKALVNLYNRIGVKSIEGHARLPSEIKKIIPFDHSSTTADVGSYFESVLQDEAWIRVKMDQMAAQFVARGLNHESSILIDYWREPLYAADLERTDIRNKETAASLLQNQSRNSNLT
jgi:hypothetical protein